MRVRYSFSSRRTRHLKNIKKQRKKFPDILVKVVKDSDILIEILDIRFITETRNIEAEKWISEQNKKLIIVFNKTDLLNKEELKKRVSELEHSRPFLFISCKSRNGISILRNVIKKEAGKIKKEKIFVGIIGYPNTGKSSVINALIGKNSAKTASEAGFTKVMQKIKLSNNIFLLDTPGVIPSIEYSSKEQKKLSRDAYIGVRTYTKVSNPEFIISDIMKTFPGVIEKYYNIESNGDVEVLIEKLGRKKSILKKGSVIDEDKTARLILKEWQEGKIKPVV